MKGKTCWILIAIALTGMAGCAGREPQGSAGSSAEKSVESVAESSTEKSVESVAESSMEKTEKSVAEETTINMPGEPTDASAEEQLQIAVDNGLVVMQNGSVTNGKDIWLAFYEKVLLGEAAEVMITQYHTLDPERVSPELYEAEKDDYPMIFYVKLEYDGEQFTLSPVHYGKEGYYVYEQIGYDNPIKNWKYLMKYEGEPKEGTGALFSSYERYVLVNDDAITWDEIEWGLLNSRGDDYVSHQQVYCEYVWK